MQISQSKITVPHRIHELKNVPQLHGAFEHVVPSITTECNGIFGERPGEEGKCPAGSFVACYGRWVYVARGGVKSTASPIHNAHPSIFFVMLASTHRFVW
jgi:hypothetical protein